MIVHYLPAFTVVVIINAVVAPQIDEMNMLKVLHGAGEARAGQMWMWISMNGLDYDFARA